MGVQNVELTGKASIDRPWMKFYPEQFQNMQVPKVTLETFLKEKNHKNISANPLFR